MVYKVVNKIFTLVQVWPFDNMRFAWLKRNPEFWNDEWTNLQGPRGPLFWHNEPSVKRFLSEEVNIGIGLDSAIESEHEVLFTSELPPRIKTYLQSKYKESFPVNDRFIPAYVAVPVSLENKLLALLDVEPYSSSISITVAEPMEANDVKRRYLNLKSNFSK